jgi:CDP-diglyceride synthetase
LPWKSGASQPNARYWLAAAFVAGFFVIGLPYWQIPYAKVSLPSTLYGPGLLVVGVLAAVARAWGKARLRAVVLVVGASVPAPILARIVAETSKDPTSHNLWPFEVIIAVMIGALCSLAGALAGSLLARLFGPKTSA